MRDQVSFTSTYEKMNKSRKTKALHSHYYSRTEHQAIDITIYATSQAEARKQLKSEITDDIEERDNYKKAVKWMISPSPKRHQKANTSGKAADL